MKIQRKRFMATITNRETGETIERELFDTLTAEGTSGEGIAFKQAQKIARETFPNARVSFAVDPVILEAELDVPRAVACGAVSAWTVKA